MELTGKYIGNYVAKAELGSGGMGVVYLCEHPLIKRRVAAKVLHEELAASEEIVRRLFAEAKAANAINSEHIIEVLDFGRMDDSGRELVYLLMEFLEGEGLGERLWRTGLTIDESLHIVRQCCDALAASHKAGIVHRDLKPENIFLLDRRGDPNFVKILDFGIAKVSGNPSTKTRTGVLLGTPAYMSPEQCRGSGSVDERADIYSLGIVIYELVTGDVPFSGTGYGQVLLAQMTEKPPPPTKKNKDLPKPIEEIILRALEKDPKARFQTMAELGKAIAEAQELLGSKQPVEQIPRKGLHQRATFVRDRRVASPPGETPMDAGLPQKMAAVAGDSPTQAMDAVVDPASVGTGTPGPGSDEQSTILDQRLPTRVRDAIKEHHDVAATMLKDPAAKAAAPAHSEPATQMSRDGAGNLTTGPRGMLAPKAPSSNAAATLVRPAPTVVRQVVESSPDMMAEAKLFKPRTGRFVLIALVAIGVAGAVLAFLLRH